MGDNADELASKSLLNISLPGTHDSASYHLTRHIIPGTLPWPLDAVVQLATDAGLSVAEYIIHWSQSQRFRLGEQLLHGIRYFDLRAGVCFPPLVTPLSYQFVTTVQSLEV
jgi:hypothetical protein